MGSPDGIVIAIGKVKEDVHGSDVSIDLLRGQFQGKKLSIAGNVFLEGASCGVPEGVNHRNSMSYKETVSSTPTAPAWYICHWWGHPVIEFITLVEEHAKRRRVVKPSYWICGYANRQHELDADICTDPSESSFSKAMKLAEGVLL